MFMCDVLAIMPIKQYTTRVGSEVSKYDYYYSKYTGEHVES